MSTQSVWSGRVWSSSVVMSSSVSYTHLFLGRTYLTAMVLLVVVAAIVGDSVGYEVGKVWGSRVLSHRLLDKRRHQLERAQDFLRRRGGSAVFLGRWTAFFRAVMPALAGVSRMPYRRLLIWNAAGGIVWGVVVVVVGYLAGLSYDRAAAWLGGGATAVVGGVGRYALIHRPQVWYWIVAWIVSRRSNRSWVRA